MGYLRDHPAFHHVLLVERDDALWLVDAGGRWTLPGFLSDEQHTAEVELVTCHVRAQYGLGVWILGAVATEFDEGANQVRKAYLAEALTPAGAGGRWWTRAALEHGEAPLSEEAASLAVRWATRSITVGDAAWSRPSWRAEALAWVSARAGAVGEAEQVRVSEFSTVLRVVVGGRPRFFKAVGPSADREPRVTGALARRTAHVPPVLAVDDARRLVLRMSNSGWCQNLSRGGRWRTSRGGRLVGSGAPSCVRGR